VTTSRARRSYVDSVVRNYLRLPGTPLRASRQDRRLAAALYDRHIPISTVWAAFVIAATRWAVRAPQQRPLDKIRSLYYFVPAIDEVLDTPPDATYIHYLATKLRPFVSDKQAHLISPDPADSLPPMPSRRQSENRTS